MAANDEFRNRVPRTIANVTTSLIGAATGAGLHALPPSISHPLFALSSVAMLLVIGTGALASRRTERDDSYNQRFMLQVASLPVGHLFAVLGSALGAWPLAQANAFLFLLLAVVMFHLALTAASRIAPAIGVALLAWLVVSVRPDLFFLVITATGLLIAAQVTVLHLIDDQRDRQNASPT